MLYLFYGGGYNNDPQQIGCALSKDGVHFERLFQEPLIPNGEPGDWNASETGHPGVFEDSDGRMYLSSNTALFSSVSPANSAGRLPGAG
jgi:beta-1,2-mannobiose phosphorylase / 1,2-beta-oligomannan phosphorylase